MIITIDKENPTNGDVIKAMFPKAKWWTNEQDRIVFTDSPNVPKKVITLDYDWWNKPYKRKER